MSTERVELNGISIPSVGLGTWKSLPGEVKNAVKVAVQNGYRHIDCAHIYENEGEVGEAFTELFEEGYNRDDIWVTSKLWNTFHNPKNVRAALQTTLDNLGLQQLDLYLVHWPMYFAPEDETDEVNHVATWKAMESLVEEGLVKYIGLSNFTTEQIRNVLDNCTIRPTFLQCESHPYLPQHELIDLCKAENIIFESYSPLGSPDRPGGPLESDPEPLLQHPTVVALSGKYQKNPGQILIKFHVQRNLVVLVKSVTDSRIISNLNISDFTISPEDMEQLSSLESGWRACAFSSKKDHPSYPF